MADNTTIATTTVDIYLVFGVTYTDDNFEIPVIDGVYRDAVAAQARIEEMQGEIDAWKQEQAAFRENLEALRAKGMTYQDAFKQANESNPYRGVPLMKPHVVKMPLQ